MKARVRKLKEANVDDKNRLHGCTITFKMRATGNVGDFTIVAPGWSRIFR